MTRFAGQAFNNIRRTDVVPPALEIARITPDELPAYLNQQQAADVVAAATYAREQAAKAAIEKDLNRFGFNPKETNEMNGLLSQLDQYDRAIRGQSVPMSEPFNDLSVRGNYGTGPFLNLASDNFKQHKFDLQGDVQDLRHKLDQQELLRMVKLERFHRLAAENEAQSFNNRLEQGLLNAPVAENRVAGKRRERQRMNNIAILREELQEGDLEEALRMKKAADKYFGRETRAKRRGPEQWDDSAVLSNNQVVNGWEKAKDYPDAPSSPPRRPRPPDPGNRGSNLRW